jgi:hypothetical protein
MTHSLAIRLNPGNPDHHLWNNNGTWFVHYTIHPTPFTKQRIRVSLGTKDKLQARSRRDRLLLKARALSCGGQLEVQR